ncbi:hypothetical protein D3C74_158320 [compost metagenome]
MLEKLNFEVGRIPFEGTEVDDVRERDLYKANQLWKDGKYRGALLCYDSVISDALKQMAGPWNRTSELCVAYLNKMQLLQKLFRANKLWSIDDCQNLFDLYDSYIKTLDGISRQAKRAEIRPETPLYTKSLLLIEKGKLTQLLTDVSAAMPIYEAALSVINELIAINSTDDRYYYDKGIHLSRMRKNQEALEPLRIAKELSTSKWLLEDIDYALEAIQKGSNFF